MQARQWRDLNKKFIRILYVTSIYRLYKVAKKADLFICVQLCASTYARFMRALLQWLHYLLMYLDPWERSRAGGWRGLLATQTNLRHINNRFHV